MRRPPAAPLKKTKLRHESESGASRARSVLWALLTVLATMDPKFSPRSEATSWQTSGDTHAEFARAIGSRIREPMNQCSSAGAASTPLPPGWEAIQDGEQDTWYFYHTLSGVSQWESPTEEPPPSTAAAAAAPTTPTAPATRELTSLSIDEVGLLLGSLGMEALRPSFAAGFVDGASLAQIDGHDLEQLGVDVGAVRRGMLARVDRLRALGVPERLVVTDPTELPPAAAALAALTLEPTLAALRRWGVEPAVAATCCERLGRLCADDETQREAACEGGAAEAVVATLGAHAADRAVQRAGCVALASLCLGADAGAGARGGGSGGGGGGGGSGGGGGGDGGGGGGEGRMAEAEAAAAAAAARGRRALCVECGALERVVTALQAAPDEAGVQEDGLRALGLLCFGVDGAAAARKRQAADLGGLIAAIDAMRAHPTCRGAQLQGCRAVATIAAGSDALEERAKAEGALRAAVCCLQAAAWSKWHEL